MASLRAKPSLSSLVALGMLLAVLYVISYAPVVRVCGGVSSITGGSEYPIYAPVDWMIDNTVLREPMFWWADLWGVYPDFELAGFYRWNLRILEKNAE